MKIRCASILLFLAIVLIIFVRPVHAQGTKDSYLLVYRVGDGSTVLTDRAAPIFLDKINYDGTSAGASIVIPQKDFVARGNDPSEGMIVLSADRHYAFFTGYDRKDGQPITPGSDRVVARVSTDGHLDTSTTLGNIGIIRGVASSDGFDLWIASSTGLYYKAFGSSNTPTPLNTTNLRAVDIFDDWLYVTTAAEGNTADVRISAVGAVPVTTTQTLAQLPGIAAHNHSIYGFYFADLDRSEPGIDTLYFADDNAGGLGGIWKYAKVGSSWVENGHTGSGSVYRGLTGMTRGGQVTLFATRDGAALDKLVDAAGYNAALDAAPGQIYAALPNTAVRGVSFAPNTSTTAVSFNGMQDASPPAQPAFAVGGVLILLGGILLVVRRR